ncbi:ECF-type riboflavin transporter substrate-binding protein [Dorea sp.]
MKGKNMKGISSIKTVVAVGIGAALFLVLGRFVAIPSPVPNTQISLQYAVLALFAVMYGPMAGGLIGLVGHTLMDLSWGGSPWWSWGLASAFAGLLIGCSAKKIRIEDGDFGAGKKVLFALVNIVAHAIAWGFIAPTLDILIYAEPANKVYLQGMFAAASNMLTGVVVGGLLLVSCSKTIVKTGSLDMEE